jgi:hypothetical protein
LELAAGFLGGGYGLPELVTGQLVELPRRDVEQVGDV